MRWFFISILIACKGAVFSTPSIDELIKKGNENYIEGNNALTVEHRKAAFNRALTYYHLANLQEGEQNADLDRAIAHSFYQLNEYPWAILYYSRALNKGALEEHIIPYLKQSREYLGLSPVRNQHVSIVEYLLLEPWISLNQKLKTFFCVVIIFFILSSIYTWFPLQIWKISSIGSALLCFFFFINILATYYMVPVEGIIMEPTGIFRGPDIAGPQISIDPLFAGTNVKVLEATTTGGWLKIENEQQLIGYVPLSNLRML